MIKAPYEAMADDQPKTGPASSGGKRTPIVRNVVPFINPERNKWWCIMKGCGCGLDRTNIAFDITLSQSWDNKRLTSTEEKTNEKEDEQSIILIRIFHPNTYLN